MRYYAEWFAIFAGLYALFVLVLMIREDIVKPYVQRGRETITPNETLENVVAPEWPNLLDQVGGDPFAGELTITREEADEWQRECESRCPGCNAELESDCEHKVVSLD